jgi:hypothetical protein
VSSEIVHARPLAMALVTTRADHAIAGTRRPPAAGSHTVRGQAGARVRAVMAALAVIAALAMGAGEAAAAESLPFATMTPEDGAVIQQTAYGGVQWRITGGPAAATSIQINVSSTPDVGTDGQTLSDLHRVGFVSIEQSSTDVGVFFQSIPVGGPYAWTNYPGTYYWQASAFWTETIPDDPNTPAYDPKYISHSAVGSIRTITVQAPQPQPQPPAPAPTHRPRAPTRCR